MAGNMPQESGNDRLLAACRKPLPGLLVALLLLAWIFLLDREADPDLFARAAVGRLIQVQGEVPQYDPFAYTLTKPIWIDHEWLSGVVFNALAQAGGDGALFLFKLLACAAALCLLVRARLDCSREGRAAVPALLLMAASSAHIWSSTVRSQVFSYLFIPFFLYAFARHAREGKVWVLIPLPLIMAFWVQAHGGFVVGLGFFSIYAVLQSRRPARPIWPVWASFLACCAASWISPYSGTSFWRYILEAVAMDRPGVTEWLPLPVFSLGALAPHLFVLLIGIGLVRARCSDAAGPRTSGVDRFAWVLLLLAAYFGYRHQRLVAILMMVAYVFFSDLMARACWPGRSVAHPTLRLIRKAAARGFGLALWLAIPVLGAACSWRVVSTGFALDYRTYPVAALEWLWNHRPEGKLLVGFNQGSYALWRLYPRFLVSLDGRYEEVYPQATVRAVEEALNPASPHHAQSLESVLPDFILVRARYDLVDPARGFGSRWQTIYQDEQYAILEPARETPVRVAGPGTEIVDVWTPRF